MGGSRSRSARQRRSDPSGQRRRSAALPASAARSEGRQRARRCSRRVRRCSCRSGTSRCRPNRSRSGSATSGFASSTNTLTTFPLSTWQRICRAPSPTRTNCWRVSSSIPRWLRRRARHRRRSRMRVTRSYLARMRRGDANDPLLRQVLPLADELFETPGYGADPLAGTRSDARARVCCRNTQDARCSSRPRPAPSIAATASGASFRIRRKRKPRKRAPRDSAPRSSVIAGDTSIEEVILSGGDPLSLSDARLTTHHRCDRRHARTCSAFACTRASPSCCRRAWMTGLLTWLRGIQRPTVFVLHTNHPNEIDSEVRAACAKLRARGRHAAQSVRAARGVNDDVDTLARAVARAHGRGRRALLPAPAGSGARHRAFRCRGSRSAAPRRGA